MKHTIAPLTLALTLAFALSPALTDPFSGFTPDQLPIAQIDPPIQPAGYAFAIWGLIYAWLIVSAVFGVWKRAKDDDWNAARLPLIASLAVGVPWLAIANASAIWATITICWMAVSAILALLRAPTRDRWWLQAPIAIYAGWLTAAFCVSLGTILAGYGVIFDSFGWAVVGILIALTLALTTYRMRKNAPEYLAVVIWALIGIIVANGAAQIWISGLAGAGIAVLITAIFMRKAQPAV